MYSPAFCRLFLIIFTLANYHTAFCKGDSNKKDIYSNQIHVDVSFPISSETVKCNVKISVWGKEVKDTFVEPCSEKEAATVSTNDWFVFGNPTINSISLYSDQPATIVVIKNKICTKKLYTTTNGVTSSVMSPLTLKKCNEIKNKMKEVLRHRGNQKVISLNREQAVLSPGNDLNTYPVKAASTPNTALLQPTVNMFKPTLSFSLEEMGSTNTPESMVESPVVASDSTGVAQRKGAYDKVQSGSYNIVVSKDKNKPCRIDLLGRGINDVFLEDCDKRENLQKIVKNHILVVADATRGFGLFTDSYNQLIVVKGGKCFKRNYRTTSAVGVTKITAEALSDAKCEEVQESISSYIGVNFGNIGLSDPTFETPIWRKGDYSKVIGSFSVTFGKDNNKCTITVIGRRINDEISEDCDVFGKDVHKITKKNILVVADPSKKFGLFSDSYDELVVVKDGKCSKRQYESSYTSGNTKITLGSITERECEEVKEAMSSFLGVVFGNPGLKDPTYDSPTWRKGEYQKVTSSSFSVTVNKDYNNKCKIVVMGRKVNDEFTEDCDIVGNNIQKITKNNILVVADPDKSFGLFSDSYNELFIIKDGECRKREYETSYVSGNTKVTLGSVAYGECDKVKETISSFLGVNFRGKEATDPSHPTTTWRKGTWETTKSDKFTVNVRQVRGQVNDCEMTVLGRGVNENISQPCSVIGSNVKSVIGNNVLVVADPSKGFGVISGSYNELVVVKDGECVKREYETSSVTGNTKVTESPMSEHECEDRIETMSRFLGTNFGGPQPTDLTSLTPLWREGEFNKVKASSFAVTTKKDNKGECTINVLGRGVNDELKNSCDSIGSNVQKITRSHILVVADPEKNFGLFSNSLNELVILMNGKCYKREYDTSSITGNTKVTPTFVSDEDCQDAEETVSSYLGVNFGHPELTDPTPSNHVWRKGTWSATKSSTFTVRVRKIPGQPSRCEMTVVGRGVNDVLREPCSVKGGKIDRITKNNILAVADTTKDFGVFSDSYEELVVVKDGECTKRQYDTSSVIGNTKVTARTMSLDLCVDVQKKMSAYLGANFLRIPASY